MKSLVPLIAAAFLWVAASAQAETIVRLGTLFGDIDLELYDDDKPITVSNFLSYIRNDRYENSFVHRLIPGFVMQGGGYTATDSVYNIPTYPPIVNEFDVGPHYSNVYGTIAMAKLGGDPNSATSQWFINLGDNSANLDYQNGGFTVFGAVISGWDALEKFNTLFSDENTEEYLIVNAGGAFTDLPVTRLENDTIYLSDLIYSDWSIAYYAGTTLAHLSTADTSFLVREKYGTVISGTPKEKVSALSLEFENNSTLKLYNTVTLTNGTLHTRTGSAVILAEGKNARLTTGKNENFVFEGEGDLRVEASLSGAKNTSLIKNDPGTLTLVAANKFGGGTVINEGTIRLENGGALGNGPLTINKGTLDLAGQSLSLSSLQVSSEGIITSSAEGGLLVLNLKTNLNYEGLFSGQLTLQKSGNGVLILHENTHTGGVILQGGGLYLADDAALGTGTFSIKGKAVLDAVNGARTFANNNEQIWSSNFTFAGTHDLNMGSGNVTLPKTITLTVADSSLTIGGAISGGSEKIGLTKAGTGTLLLTGQSTYQGTTNIKAGALVLGEGASLQSRQINLGKNTLLVINQNSNGGYNGTISGSGTLVKDGPGLFVLQSPNSYKGGTDIRDGILAVAYPSSLGTGDVIIRQNGVLATDGFQTQISIKGDLLWENGARIALTLTPDVETTQSLTVSGSFSLLNGGVLTFDFNIDPSLLGESFLVMTALKGFNGLDASAFTALGLDGVFEIRPGQKKSQELWFTYNGDAPGQIILLSTMAVPEPSTYILLIIGLLVILFRFRRRFRN